MYGYKYIYIGIDICVLIVYCIKLVSTYWYLIPVYI